METEKKIYEGKVDIFKLDELIFEFKGINTLLRYLHVAIIEGPIKIDEKKLDSALYQIIIMQERLQEEFALILRNSRKE